MGKLAPNDANTGKEMRKATVTTDETNWGYVIRSPDSNRALAVIKRFLASGFGFLLLLAAIGLWVLPGSIQTQDVVGFKIAVSSMMAIFAAVILWHASQTTKYEFQVNLERRELRVVLRKLNGVALVQNQFSFEDVKEISIAPAATEHAKARLLLELEDNSQAIEAARDFEEHLTRLRNRLGRDVLGEKEVILSESSRGIVLGTAKNKNGPDLAA